MGWGALSPQIPGPASLAPCAAGLATVNGNVARRLARGRETAGVSTLVSQPADLQPRQADSHASGLLSAASHGRVRGVCVVVCGTCGMHMPKRTSGSSRVYDAYSGKRTVIVVSA